MCGDARVHRLSVRRFVPVDVMDFRSKDRVPGDSNYRSVRARDRGPWADFSSSFRAAASVAAGAFHARILYIFIDSMCLRSFQKKKNKGKTKMTGRAYIIIIICAYILRYTSIPSPPSRSNPSNGNRVYKSFVYARCTRVHTLNFLLLGTNTTTSGAV